MGFFDKELEKVSQTVSEERRKESMLEVVVDMNLSKPVLEATLISTLYHIYEGDDIKIINYLAKLQYVHEMNQLGKAKKELESLQNTIKRHLT